MQKSSDGKDESYSQILSLVKPVWCEVLPSATMLHCNDKVYEWYSADILNQDQFLPSCNSVGNFT